MMLMTVMLQTGNMKLFTIRLQCLAFFYVFLCFFHFQKDNSSSFLLTGIRHWVCLNRIINISCIISCPRGPPYWPGAPRNRRWQPRVELQPKKIESSSLEDVSVSVRS